MAHEQFEVVRLYRRLYRQGLQAVRYSSPARHVLRKQLNVAFRNGKSPDVNAPEVNNTLRFLQNATKEAGLEHRILKNLLHVYWSASPKAKQQYGQPLWNGEEAPLPIATWRHFNITLRMLNQSMGILLPEAGAASNR